MDKEQVADRRLDFGQELKKAREAKGVSLPGLAQATRIRLDFVEALESGDFTKLPGEVFGRGFVRSIARTLGADQDGLIALFDAAWGPSEAPQSVLKVEIKNKPTRDANEKLRIRWANTVSILRRGLGLKTIVPIAAVLGVLGGGVFGLVRGGHALVTRVRQASVERSVVATDDPGPEEKASPASVDKSQIEKDATSAGPVADSAEVIAAPESQANTQVALPKAPEKSSHNVEATSKMASEVASSLPKKTTPSMTEPKAIQGASPADSTAAQGDGEQQVLELVVSEPVRIRLDADQQPTVTKELTPDTYRFTFGTKADLMVYDAAALKVLFNGKSLGSLGNKGRIRRLSFQAEALKAEKKL